MSAIVFVDAQQSGCEADTTITISIDAGSNPNRVMALLVGWQDPLDTGEISSTQFDGIDFDQPAGFGTAPLADGFYIWRATLTAPNTGTHDVVITFPNAVTGRAFALSFDNCNGYTLAGDFPISAGTFGNNFPTDTVTGAGDVGVGALWAPDGDPFFPSGTLIIRAFQNSGMGVTVLGAAGTQLSESDLGHLTMQIGRTGDGLGYSAQLTIRRFPDAAQSVERPPRINQNFARRQDFVSAMPSTLLTPPAPAAVPHLGSTFENPHRRRRNLLDWQNMCRLDDPPAPFLGRVQENPRGPQRGPFDWRQSRMLEDPAPPAAIPDGRAILDMPLQPRRVPFDAIYASQFLEAVIDPAVDIFRGPLITRARPLLPNQDWIWQSSFLEPGPPPVPPEPPTGGRTLYGRTLFGCTIWELRALEEARRLREATLPELPPQVRDYSDKSRKIAAAIVRFREDEERLLAEAAALRERIAALEARRRARGIAKLRRELLLNEQALQLAQAQEAALLEEMEVIDIAYFAYMALAMTIQ